MKALSNALALALAIGAVTAATPAQAAPAWLAPEQIGQADELGSIPQVSFDADGNATAVWGQAWFAEARIWASSRPASGHWSAPEIISVPGEIAAMPQIAIDEDGDVIAVWEIAGGGVQVAERPRGGAWDAPLELNDDGGSPRVAAGGDGAAAIVWESDGAYGTARPDHDTDWPKATQLSEDDEAAESPAVALRADESAVATWQRPARGIEHAVLRHAEQRPDGAWDAPGYLSGGAADAKSPALAAGGGEAIVAWTEFNGGRDKLLTRRLDPSGTWGPTQQLSEQLETVSGPHAAMNDAGEAIVAWQSNEAFVRAVVQGPGGTFTAAFSSEYEDETEAGGARAAIGPAGDAIVAWTRQRDDGNGVQAAVRPRGGAWGTAADVSAPDGLLTGVNWDGDGNAIVVGLRRDTFTVFATGYDGAPPRLGPVTAPTSAISGEPSAFAATATDVWSPVSLSWDFGDGAPPAPGSAVSHVFGAAGRYEATVTATDALGNAASAPAATVDVTIPPAPNGSANPPGPPADGALPGDRSGPVLTFTVARGGLRTVLKRGLKVRVKCGEPCALTAKLTRRNSNIARGSARMTRPGATTLVMKLSARARKQLARTRRVRLALVVEATDPAGNKTRKSVPVTLRR